MESSIVRISPRDFRTNSHGNKLVEDYIISLSPEDKETILKCPFLTDGDVVGLVGIWDEKVIGAIKFCFPLKIRAYEEELYVASGSSLFVDEEYRNDSGMGAFLMMEKTKIHPSKNCLSAGISQMALPLYKKLKYAVFETPRMMFIKHSRSVVEHYLPIRGVILSIVSSIIDCCLSSYYWIAFHGKKLNLYTCRLVTSVTPEILNIIEQDNHPFAELHNKEWWEWILNNTLGDSNSKKQLFEVIRGGEVVGFFLNKIEFHESASSRGFKNVHLGSVIEWGVKNNKLLSETQVQLLAIKNMPSEVDAIEVTSTDVSVLNDFKKSLMRKVGYTNIAVRIKELPKGSWENMDLWRIRMAASDVSIN